MATTTRARRLSPADLTNLAVEAPDTPMHVGALAILDGAGPVQGAGPVDGAGSVQGAGPVDGAGSVQGAGPVDGAGSSDGAGAYDGGGLFDGGGRLRLDELRGEINTGLAGVPVLRQVVYSPGLLAGRPLWTDDPDFRIERHVNQIELGEAWDEAALLRLAETLMAPRLDRDHPLWRIWFVTGGPDTAHGAGTVGGARPIAVLVTFHHAIADGLAAVELLTALLDPPARSEPWPPWIPMARPTWRDLALDNLRSRLGRLRLPRVAGFGALRRGLAQSGSAARTSLTGPIGPRRQLAVLRVDLATAKTVAHAHGSKINDVILTLAAGGLRAILPARGEDPARLVLNAAVAVSLRAGDRAVPAENQPVPTGNKSLPTENQPVPTGNRPLPTGNRSGIIVVRLPLAESDPAARLRRVASASARAKQHQVANTVQGLLVWLARSGLLRWFTRRQRLTNLVESNVIGPAEPIRLLRAPVRAIIPIGALAGNLAISFLALSYAGQLTIAVRVDADRYPDLSGLMAAMADDWGQLEAGVVEMKAAEMTAVGTEVVRTRIRAAAG